MDRDGEISEAQQEDEKSPPVSYTGNVNISRWTAMLYEGTCGVGASIGEWDWRLVLQKDCRTYLRHVQHDSGVTWAGWG